MATGRSRASIPKPSPKIHIAPQNLSFDPLLSASFPSLKHHALILHSRPPWLPPSYPKPFFILSLLFLSPFSSACVPCNPAPPKLTPMPPAKVPPVNPFCPRDTLKLGACVDLLGGVVNLVVGSPVSSKCCALLEGLADLEVAACLCTAIKANCARD
ncbi:bifunctional inhibitor/lipid-transfer protein/seed storage 2S albumin superfamily protein [Actinidia rufa]|uniref:Bifunctional inhibitor/lipid-transfer protein/seed storage 2S albumin superfamily protein n=1 Tax=Actinidia rufa TaxID=165716 RepID=A0A7J0H0R7_9ERIC|nr:bifunctional inhibitor/lipid-transfer protein/seed storage 2S albumin superfamily protein [Actinidia rufa]